MSPSALEIAGVMNDPDASDNCVKLAAGTIGPFDLVFKDTKKKSLSKESQEFLYWEYLVKNLNEYVMEPTDREKLLEIIDEIAWVRSKMSVLGYDVYLDTEGNKFVAEKVVLPEQLIADIQNVIDTFRDKKDRWCSAI